MFGSFKGAVVPQKTVQTAKPTASAVVEVCIAFRSIICVEVYNSSGQSAGNDL